MSLYSSFQRIASEWAAARRMAETERMIGSLSADLRKDIGWPTESGRSYRPAANEFAGKLHS